MRTVISTICTKMKSFGNDTLIPMRNRVKSRENDYLFGNALVHIYTNVGVASVSVARQSYRGLCLNYLKNIKYIPRCIESY
jgi:hypothetical protein